MSEKELLLKVGYGVAGLLQYKFADNEITRKAGRVRYLAIKRELAKTFGLTYQEVDETFKMCAVDAPIRPIYNQFAQYLGVRV